MMQNLKRFIIITILICLLAAAFSSCTTVREYPADGIRVACIGDSITEGSYMLFKKKYCYPSRLAGLLGDGYVVENFGVNGACAMAGANKPYTSLPEYRMSVEFSPDIVLFMLGSNDTKTFNWNRASFNEDYRNLVSAYINLPSEPEVIIMTSIPALSGMYGIQGDVVQNELLPDVLSISRELNIDIIDLNKGFEGMEQYYLVDGLHLNREGGEYMGKLIFESIDWQNL